MTDLQKIQDLYDRNLFLQAYRQSAAYWCPSTNLNCLSPDELVLGGRLAVRLGGPRLSQRLFREAYRRDPSNPTVKFYTRWICRRGWHLIDVLQAFEENPDLGGGGPKLQAGWLASHAVTLAGLRDFARAGECIDRARSLAEQDSWVWSCQSDVLGLADRWQEALKFAERAFELNPGSHHVLECLCSALVQRHGVNKLNPHATLNSLREHYMNDAQSRRAHRK